MPKPLTLEEFVKTQREFIHITQGFNNEDLVARFPISAPPSIIVQELLLCYLMAVRTMIQEDELEITDHILAILAVATWQDIQEISAIILNRAIKARDERTD